MNTAVADTEQLMNTIGQRATVASKQLATLSSQQKNTILMAMANGLEQHTQTILQANEKDLQNAREQQLSPALIDRLALNPQRIAAMAAGFRQVSQLNDPVGAILNEMSKDNGLLIRKVRVPIGVIGIIYESRPNVTADVTALCFKTANAVILRGGKEAQHSNQAIAEALLQSGIAAGLPQYAMQLVPTTDREAVRLMAQMDGVIDLIIPRGGEGLINAVVAAARVPVIKHYKGLCHTYIDASANIDMAIAICENAKCQRPGVCNAMETLLVHCDIAAKALPPLCTRLQSQQVTLKGDVEARAIVPELEPATIADWDTEYLDLTLSIKVVGSLEAAIDHINTHGSHHSDAIIAESPTAQEQFSKCVDSAATYVNASTRFTDGAEFGMGAEIGISTDKLHARGPMGLEELTTYKYVIMGSGQIRHC